VLIHQFRKRTHMPFFKTKNIAIASTTEQPTPIHITVTSTSSHTAYRLEAPNGWSHTAAQPYDASNGTDGLVVATLAGLATLTTARKAKALAAIRSWVAFSSPVPAAPDAPPTPALLPITIATTSPDPIQTQLAQELSRFDVTWTHLTDDSPTIAHLEAFAVLAVPSKRILERNQENEREYQRDYTASLARLSPADSCA
jgi:hypothetical protein